MVDADTSLTYHRSFMSPRFRQLFALIIVCSLAAPVGLGCAESDDDTRPVTYSLTAKQNYEKGVAELKDESYGEAKKYFQFVKQKFPFSKYAVMAELAIADTQFAQGNYTESIDSYKSFARLHPTHEKVEDGYVAFRICEGYFKDMPDDIWIMPPSYEKDQSAVNDAARELAEFNKKFPDSPYGKKVAEMRKEVMKRLVDHEVYVARFYLKNDHPKAAAIRIEGAIKRYPGSGREPELLYSLGETYLHMDDPLRAKETFTRVVTDYGVGAAGAPVGAVPRVHRPALRPEPAAQADRRRARGGPWLRPVQRRTPATCAPWPRAAAPTTPRASMPRPSPA